MKIFKLTFLLIMIVLTLGIHHAQAIDLDTSSAFLYPEYSKKISMDFQNARLVDVLKIFSEQSNMNLITAEGITDRAVTVYLDNVPIEQALEQILRANNLTYELQAGSDIYIVKPISRPAVELTTRVYHLKHASVSSAQINSLLNIEGASAPEENIVTAIESVLTSQGKIKENSRTNSLIVTDIATNFPVIEQTITGLDVPIPQILIEVEMLDVTAGLIDKAGIEWSGTFLAMQGAIKNTIFPFEGSVPGLDKQQNGSDVEEGVSTVGTISAAGLTATLAFLKTDSKTKSLARPTILTLNNQPAEIEIVTDETTSIDTVVDGDANTSQTSATRTETGVSLIVTPQANVDTGIITMVIKPSVSVAKTSTISDDIKDPETRSAQAMMKIKNGDTIIMGGLIREEVNETYKKVPLLGDIPIIKKAFSYHYKTKDDRELLIFITPHILEDSDTALPQKTISRNLMREQEAPK